MVKVLTYGKSSSAWLTGGVREKPDGMNDSTEIKQSLTREREATATKRALRCFMHFLFMFLIFLNPHSIAKNALKSDPGGRICQEKEREDLYLHGSQTAENFTLHKVLVTTIFEP